MKNPISFIKNTPLLLFILLVTGCSSPGEKKPTDDTASKPKTYDLLIVEIKQMKFEPAVLKCHINDTILFVNRDMVLHDVTEEKTKAWSSSPLATDSFYKMVVTDSVNYFCALHPVMKGKIVLE